MVQKASFMFTFLQPEHNGGIRRYTVVVAPVCCIPEQAVLGDLQLGRPLQAPGVAGRFVQVQQATHQEGVVLQYARDRGQAARKTRELDIMNTKSDNPLHDLSTVILVLFNVFS